MIKKIKHYIKEIILFFLVMTVFANGLSLYKSRGLNKEPLALDNIVLINNEKFSIDDSKPILVHYWATWCPTCRVEATNIETLSKTHQVLTIAVKSGSDEEIQKWMNQNNYTFNVMNDKNGLISYNYKVGVFPTSLVYDKDKKVVFSDVGYTSTWGLYLRMWWAGL